MLFFKGLHWIDWLHHILMVVVGAPMLVTAEARAKSGNHACGHAPPETVHACFSAAVDHVDACEQARGKCDVFLLPRLCLRCCVQLVTYDCACISSLEHARSIVIRALQAQRILV
eukprot:6181439-Pleurochrysis_carterae.AAC.1